jgi:hypothetical protein
MKIYPRAINIDIAIMTEMDRNGQKWTEMDKTMEQFETIILVLLLHIAAAVDIWPEQIACAKTREVRYKYPKNF